MSQLILDVEQKTDKSLTLALTGALSVNYAESMKPVCEPYVKGGKDLALNLSRVEDIDVSGIQLLLCLQKNQIAQGCGFRVFGLKAQLTQDLTALGLSGVLI